METPNSDTDTVNSSSHQSAPPPVYSTPLSSPAPDRSSFVASSLASPSRAQPPLRARHTYSSGLFPLQE